MLPLSTDPVYNQCQIYKQNYFFNLRIGKDLQECKIRNVSEFALNIYPCYKGIAKKENCQLPLELAERIAAKSNRNLRRAILLTEACRVAQYPFTDGKFII